MRTVASKLDPLRTGWECRAPSWPPRSRQAGARIRQARRLLQRARPPRAWRPPNRAETLRVASQTPTAAVNPLTIADLGGSTMLTQTGEFLAYDDAMTRQLRPMLATSWSPSSDGAVWTFKLRTGVKFHDGRAMSANDVVYTFKEQTDPKNASNALSTFEGLLKPEGVVRLDDLHRPLERGALQEQDLRQSGGTLRRDDRSADPANDRGQDSSQLRRDALSIPYFKALAIGSELLYNHRRLRIRHRSEG